MLPSMIHITKSTIIGVYKIHVVLKNGGKLLNDLKVALYQPGVLQQVGSVSKVFKAFATVGAAFSVYSVIQEWTTKTPSRL